MPIYGETKDTRKRLFDYPFALESELRDAANDHGYRIEQGQAAGWLFFSSASASGEIAVAATAAGLDGPFYLSVAHPGAARELKAETASPCAKGHAAAFCFPSRDALFAGVSDTYRLSVSLPTYPYEQYLKHTAHLGDTEAERLQKVRLGQDRFRGAVMDYWNSVCPITSVCDPQLLRASHIIPWADCESDKERLNAYNGLLLSALWDAAFDCGLITFGNEGHAIASPSLSKAGSATLKLENAQLLQLTDQHKERLDWHRSHIWIKD